MKNVKSISATLLVIFAIATMTVLPLLAQSTKTTQPAGGVNRIKSNAVATSNSITGTVTAAFATTPTNLSGVKVRLYGPIANNLRTASLTPLVGTSQITDVNGAYTFTPIATTTTASSHYVLTFEKAGFIPGSVNATAAANSGANPASAALLPALQLNAVCSTTGNYSWRLRNGNGATYNYTYGMLRGSASSSGSISNTDIFITVPKASAGLGILRIMVSGFTVASAQAQNLSCPTATLTGTVTNGGTPPIFTEAKEISGSAAAQQKIEQGVCQAHHNSANTGKPTELTERLHTGGTGTGSVTNVCGGGTPVPLSGVSVTVKDANNNTVGTGTTNSSGVYTITNISVSPLISGTYSVTFSSPGYATNIVNVTIGGGQTVTQNVQLAQLLI